MRQAPLLSRGRHLPGRNLPLEDAWRGDGFYLSWMKIATVWLLLLAWIGVADWVNRDLEDTGLKWQLWNPIVVGGFMAAMLLSFVIPWFWLNIFLLLGGAAGPVAAYVLYRNKKMPPIAACSRRATSASGTRSG